MCTAYWQCGRWLSPTQANFSVAMMTSLSSAAAPTNSNRYHHAHQMTLYRGMEPSVYAHLVIAERGEVDERPTVLYDEASPQGGGLQKQSHTLGCPPC